MLLRLDLGYFCIRYYIAHCPLKEERLAMAERRPMPRDDDEGSLLSKLGTDSPKPRVKFGGMFCNVEGAYENKTLNFESFSPNTQRRHVRTRQEDRCHSDTFSDTSSVSNFSSVSEKPSRASRFDAVSCSRGQTIVYPTGHNRTHNGKREVNCI